MLSGPSLGRLLKIDLWGPGKDVMSSGWGCPEPPGQALPYSQGTARAEIRSASPHPPGTSVSPGRSRDHLRAAGGAGRPGSEPPQHLPQGKGRLEEGVGVSLEEGDRVRGVGARGRTAWCQGQRGGLVWALKARKGEAGAGVAGHPHLGWKNSELFRSCLAPAVPLGVPCPKLESARTINA